MQIRGIREELLNMLLELGKSQHPCEFLAILKEENGVVSDLELVPGTISRLESASFSPYMLPLDTHVAGSAHSHPNGVLSPSSADLRFFPSIGRYHLIIGYPYGRHSWRCFTPDGTSYPMEVIA
ncbi:MAG: Mov34/MPN/PAD-1 family protein [Methanomicrobiaceae archaeon]|nr:Mov34/MPN/PAD-1 family protein [Methanomicrobiaceae archaeon]